MLDGIDISKWQRDFGMNVAADAGMRFVICKASENGFVDPEFAQNWKQLLEVAPTAPAQLDRVYRGAYHFARPDKNVGAAGGEFEAKVFVAAIKKHGDVAPGSFCFALDYEKRTAHDVALNVAFVERWLHVVEQELGRRPWIYSGPTIWNSKGGMAGCAKFIDYPLWLARWSKTAKNPPRMLKSGPDWPWAMWQWFGGGEGAVPVPGIGIVDRNRFNGDEFDLARYALISSEPSVPNSSREYDGPLSVVAE